MLERSLSNEMKNIPRNSFLESGCTIKGNLIVDRDLRIDGKVTGDILIKGDLSVYGEVVGNVDVKGNLYLGKSAYINGNVNSANAVLYGEIEGNIITRHTLQMGFMSVLRGNGSFMRLLLEDGSTIIGKLFMYTGGSVPKDISVYKIIEYKDAPAAFTDLVKEFVGKDIEPEINILQPCIDVSNHETEEKTSKPYIGVSNHEAEEETSNTVINSFVSNNIIPDLNSKKYVIRKFL